VVNMLCQRTGLIAGTAQWFVQAGRGPMGTAQGGGRHVRILIRSGRNGD
jgi:hypothetical protein